MLDGNYLNPMENASTDYNDIIWTGDNSPWVSRAANSYADRMRVDNFSKAGNLQFQAIVRRAMLGHVVYFVMVPNGRKAETKDIPIQPFVQNSSGEFTDDTEGVDSQTKQPTFTRHIVISGQDPVDVATMQDPGAMQDLVSRIAYTGFDGLCYDSDHRKIDAIYALKLSDYPITGAARAIANRAEIFDRYMLAYMRNMIVPERFIVGTEKDVQVEQRKQRERSAEDVTTIPATDTKAGMVVPKYDSLPQWDNGKVSQYLEFTANEFVGETKVPPVDFPELGTLSQTTQSLVANREAFVSRVLSFKAQVEAVFNSAGIPELSWQSTFPYTPQDIASIGDAAGKGVNADALRNYQGFLA